MTDDGNRKSIGAAAHRRGPWTSAEVARQADANRAQVLQDRARGIGANLSEASALARFANRFADAFHHVRRSA
ncbi:MAG TPA: hypothetical protein VGF95_07760 [Solirubrobacteraceae bacterium]|jgi:hypothetical protein